MRTGYRNKDLHLCDGNLLINSAKLIDKFCAVGVDVAYFSWSLDDLI